MTVGRRRLGTATTKRDEQLTKGTKLEEAPRELIVRNDQRVDELEQASAVTPKESIGDGAEQIPWSTLARDRGEILEGRRDGMSTADRLDLEKPQRALELWRDFYQQARNHKFGVSNHRRQSL